jgi:hypothetical protein
MLLPDDAFHYGSAWFKTERDETNARCMLSISLNSLPTFLPFPSSTTRLLIFMANASQQHRLTAQ